MVLAKYVAWYAYGLNCCFCQWSYPVFWIFTDVIPPHYMASECSEVSREHVFIGAKCPGKHWGDPILVFSGS